MASSESQVRIVPSEDILPKLVKVLDLITMRIKTKKQKETHQTDIYDVILKESKMNQIQSVKVGRQCINLTNQCLSGQRYEEAAKFLWILFQDTAVFDIFLFRVTMLVLENIDIADRNETVHKFLSKILHFNLVNKKEVRLEYIIYGLRNCVSDIRIKSKAFVNKGAVIKFGNDKSLRKHAILDPILDAYCAYLDYLYAYGPFQSESICLAHVILKFRCIIKEPGDWDIFVLKLVEMLSKNEQGSEIEKVLLEYCEKNPSNLNAHIYLCTHLYHHNPDSELLIPHLKIIATLSPSDERVLLLLEKLRPQEEERENCLQLAFNFLDYPSNGKNVEGWKMLCNILSEITEKKSRKDVKKAHWRPRKRVWYWMYFNPTDIKTLAKTDYKLTALKICFLNHMEKDHAYITEIAAKYPKVLKKLKDSNLL